MSSPGNTFSRKVLIFAAVTGGLVLVSIAGYALIEGWSLVESAYMTAITLSTVGFSEVRPLSTAGRVFTIVIILSGVGTLAYFLSSAAEYIVAGELQGTLQRRRMQRTIDALKDHYILCGYGRVGRQVARELAASGADVVVIDTDARRLAEEEPAPRFHILGDASDDDVLVRAGIERARGLVAATGTDAENVFITLTARSLKRDLVIVVRGIMPDSERKLRKAGADHVILPHAIGGRRMAGVLMRPTVVDFLDVVMHSEDLELWLEDIRVEAGSGLAGHSVGQAHVRSRTGANVLAVKSAGGQLLTDVSATYEMRAGDVLVVLGTREQLRALSLLAHEGAEGEA
ncbi:MAG: potassium channel family protein [Anaerolineae bacterium]